MGKRLDEVNFEIKQLEKRMIAGDNEMAQIRAKWKEKQMALQRRNTELHLQREILIKLEGFPGIEEEQVVRILGSMINNESNA